MPTCSNIRNQQLREERQTPSVFKTHRFKRQAAATAGPLHGFPSPRGGSHARYSLGILHFHADDALRL
jgi:hypothetical protein